MNEKYIKKLILLVEESDIESLEVSTWGRKVKITQRLPAHSNGHSDAVPVLAAVATPQSEHARSAGQPPGGAAPPIDETKNLLEIKSPMVGTFYAAPSPESAPYVSLNERITAGQVVCIVEAMKLMNEIEAESAGRVVRILVENAKPVEFGQVLFLVDPAA